MSESEVDFWCGFAFTVCYVVLVVVGNVYAWCGLFWTIKNKVEVKDE